MQFLQKRNASGTKEDRDLSAEGFVGALIFLEEYFPRWAADFLTDPRNIVPNARGLAKAPPVDISEHDTGACDASCSAFAGIQLELRPPVCAHSPLHVCQFRSFPSPPPFHPRSL